MSAEQEEALQGDGSINLDSRVFSDVDDGNAAFLRVNPTNVKDLDQLLQDPFYWELPAKDYAENIRIVQRLCQQIADTHSSAIH